MITCLHCGAETSNGLALCELCRRKVSTDLEFLPIYFRNLARWRPGRAGSRPVPGSRVLYDGAEPSLGTGDRISDTLDETLNALTTWARALVDDRPHFARPLTFIDAVLSDDLSDETAEVLADDPAQTVAALCDGFQHHLTSISTLDWCGELVRELGEHEARLRGITEVYVPGWYAGGCRQVVGFDVEGAAVRCESGTYVVPGLTWVKCGACGATTYARDHLENVLNEARDWVSRPKPLAEAVVSLLDTEASVPRLYARIRQWSKRGDIKPIHHTTRGYAWDDETERMVVVDEATGHARYRLGDVLDLVLRNTRAANRDRVS